MQISRISSFTGNRSIMDLAVTENQISAYLGGALIQDAFPNLNDDEREFIKTGITPAEWTKYLGDDD